MADAYEPISMDDLKLNKGKITDAMVLNQLNPLNKKVYCFNKNKELVCTYESLQSASSLTGFATNSIADNMGQSLEMLKNDVDVQAALDIADKYGMNNAG